MPATSASTNVSAKPSTSTMPAKAAARIRSAATAQPRRDQRSAAAPNKGPRNIAGTTSASSTSPIAQGESKRSSATSSSAT